MNTDVEFLGLYDRMNSAKSDVRGDVTSLLFGSSNGSFAFSKKSSFPFRCFQCWRAKADPLEDSLKSLTSFLTTVHRRNKTQNRENFKQKLAELIATISRIADHVIGKFEEKQRAKPSEIIAQRLTALREAKSNLQGIIQVVSPLGRRQAAHERNPSATMHDIAALQEVGNEAQEGAEQEGVEIVGQEDREGAESLPLPSSILTPVLEPMNLPRHLPRSRTTSGRVSTSVLPSIAENNSPRVNEEEVQALWQRLRTKDNRARDELLASGDFLQHTILHAPEDILLMLFSGLIKDIEGKEKCIKMLSAQEEYVPVLCTLANRKLEKVLALLFNDLIRGKALTTLTTLLQVKTTDKETVLHVLAKRGLQNILELCFRTFDAIDAAALKEQKKQKLNKETETKIKNSFREARMQLLSLPDANKTTLFFRMLQGCNIAFLSLADEELMRLLEPINSDNENGLYFLFDESDWKTDKSKLIIAVLDKIKNLDLDKKRKIKTAGKLLTIPLNATRTPFSISFSTRKTLRTMIIRKTLTRVLELKEQQLFRHLVAAVGSHTRTNVLHYMAHDKQESLQLFERLKQAGLSCDDFLSLLQAKDSVHRSPFYYAATAGNTPILKELGAFFNKPNDRTKFLPLLYDVALVMGDNKSKTLFAFLTEFLTKDELERLFISADESNRFYLVRAAQNTNPAPLEMILTYFSAEPERLVRILTELMFHIASVNDEGLFERIRQKVQPRELFQLLVKKDRNDVSPVFKMFEGKFFTFLQSVFDAFMRVNYSLAIDLVLTTKDSPRTLLECVLGTQDLESFALGKHIFDCFLTQDEKVIQSIVKQSPTKLHELLSALVRVAPGFLADYANGSVEREVQGHPNFIPLLKTYEERNIQAGYIPMLSIPCDFPNSIKELLNMQQLRNGVYAQYRDHVIAWKLHDSLELFQDVQWEEELDDSGNTLAHYMVEEDLVRTYAECTKRDEFHRAAIGKHNIAGKTAEEMALASPVFQAYRKRISEH